MSTVMTLRVPDDAAAAIKAIAKRQRRSLSQVGALAIEEWTRMQEFPGIEFRTVGDQRLACVKGRLAVWQIALVAGSYANDISRTAEHVCLPNDVVAQALAYAAHYAEEIDAMLERNDRGPEALRSTIPSLETIAIPADQAS